MRRIPITAVLFVAVILTAGCTPHQPNAVVPVQPRNANYVLAVVVDVSGSFESQLETKAWPFLQKLLRDFYRDRAGEDDVLIVGQISAVPVAPLFEGSPKSFAKKYGNAKAFRELLKSHSNPQGSRVHDSVADVARYASRYLTDQNQAFLCVLSDFEENFPEPKLSEERLVQAMTPYARSNAAVGFYWVDLRFVGHWEQNLKRAGVKNFVVRSAIEADPQMPRWGVSPMSDAIARFDLCSSLIVAILVYAMARQVAAGFPRFARAMVWTGIATFLVVGIIGYRGISSNRPLEILAVLFVAGIAASVAALAAAVLLPPFASLWDGWKESREKQESARQQIELALQKHREELERAEAHARWTESERLRVASMPPPPVPPPPPTREEREQRARQRYESSLRLLDSLELDEYERKAGRDVAKQKLFQDLDGVL